MQSVDFLNDDAEIHYIEMNKLFYTLSKREAFPTQIPLSDLSDCHQLLSKMSIREGVPGRKIN